MYLIRDRWLSMRADACRTATGVHVEPYYVMECRDWVHIVAVDNDGRLLTVRQYRHGTGTMCVELPGGEVESGESPEDAARRELTEETGYSAAEFRLLGSFFPNPARQNNTVHCFFAQPVVYRQAPSLEATEEIETAFITLAQVPGMIADGRFSQGLHIASIHLYTSFLSQGGQT